MKDKTKNLAAAATKRDVPSGGHVTYHRREPRSASYQITIRAK